MNHRELIEQDQKYRRLKRVILHAMSFGGVTGWYDDGEWLEMLPGMTENQYRQTIRDLLDDAEVRREYDRDTTPTKTRWVMRERKDQK